MNPPNDPRYQTQSLGSPAPIIWYASLPAHVRQLYDYKSLANGHPALMVILADVVCQSFTIWTLEQLFQKRNMKELWEALSGGNKSKVRRLQEICNDDVKEIYIALSADPIAQATFWEELKKHKERRNALVHPDHKASTAAIIPSQQEAEESFKAVEDYINHVISLLGP